MLFYDMAAPKSKARGGGNVDPHVQWAKHYANGIKLRAYLMYGSFDERHQASLEISVAERKQAFWERHADFDVGYSTLIASRVKKALHNFRPS